MQPEALVDDLDLIWGAEEIAKAMGRTTRATFHMLESGEITPAKQIGRRWVVSRRRLREFFESGAAA